MHCARVLVLVLTAEFSWPEANQLLIPPGRLNGIDQMARPGASEPLALLR